MNYNYVLLCVISFQLLSLVNGWLITSNISSPVGLHRFKRSMRNVHHKPTCINCDEETEGKCSKKAMIRIQRFTEQLKCLPEPTLIRLDPPGPKYTINPSFTRVKRCNGHCRVGIHACIPRQVAMVKVPVLLINHQTGLPRCVHYEVMEHQSCECDCETPSEHCSERHRHESCQCRCQNEKDKYECLDNSRKAWDEETCECIEREEQSCPDGWTWNACQYRCAPIVAPSDIENNLYK